MNHLHLHPGHLSLADLRHCYAHPVQLTLDASAGPSIDASVACVEKIIAEGRTAYGINTGFGLLASTKIGPEDLAKLQRSLVLSHAAGVGEALPDAMVRLIMVLKINSLARGISGIRRADGRSSSKAPDFALLPNRKPAGRACRCTRSMHACFPPRALLRARPADSQ